jgi:predicted DNA-binding transcriptional regulator YafY
MKIDRLLGIVIFLMNHEQTTAQELAEEFEVSVRTIKRDMETINLAGIPIRSILGVHGGYSIEPRFTLNKQFVKKQEYMTIITALIGLQSSFHSKNFQVLLDKYKNLVGDSKSNSIFLDYSTAQEGSNVQQSLEIMDNAIHQRRHILISYRNAQQDTSQRKVQPLALTCKWYDWYLFAYCERANDYRLFKITRIKKATMLDSQFQEYKNIEELMKKHDHFYSESCMDIALLIQDKDRDLLKEFFPKGTFEPIDEMKWIMHLRLPEYEQIWKAKLIALGDRVKILKPESLRKELVSAAHTFIANNGAVSFSQSKTSPDWSSRKV